MDNKIPDKIKDQHIIVDKSVIGKIVNAASLTGHDSVLEIGGGPGNLTKAIAANAGLVYAIEKDPGYIVELKKIFWRQQQGNGYRRQRPGCQTAAVQQDSFQSSV